MRSDDLRLGDVIDACRAAQLFIEGRSREDVDPDPLLRAALLHEITVIGEAARALNEVTRRRYPSVPWEDMTGMRNWITHAYWRVDGDELWRTVTVDIPELLAALQPPGDAASGDVERPDPPPTEPPPA
jgi:uncharacterized protein with HEPN domain